MAYRNKGYHKEYHRKNKKRENERMREYLQRKCRSCGALCYGHKCKRCSKKNRTGMLSRIKTRKRW